MAKVEGDDGVRANLEEKMLSPEWHSQALKDVEKLLDICGVPSISLGVLHHGKVVLEKSFGFRNVERTLLADSRTKYHIGSVSKTFLAALAGITDSGGRLQLDKPLFQQLPGLDPAIHSKASVLDVLHTTSLSNPQILYLGPGSSILHTGPDFCEVAKFIPTSQAQGQLGQQWVHKDTAYGLIPYALEAAYSREYSELLKQTILTPLGLNNTAVTRGEFATDDDNVAFPYVQRSDKTFERLHNNLTDEDYPHVLGVMGMQSCVEDLLAWTKAVMAEDTEAVQYPDQRSHPSILRGATVARIPFSETWARDDVNGWVSCMGWTKTQMPTSKFGALSYNFAAKNHRSTQPEKYIMGRNDTTNRTILQSNGTVNGSNCGLYTFPETESAIVVCSNGLTNGDAADWAARILTEALFNLQPRTDFLELAKIEGNARKANYQVMLTARQSISELSQNIPTALRFVGTYYGMGTTLTIRARLADPASLIKVSALRLEVVFNSVELSRRDLTCHRIDAWSFFPTSRDEWLRDQTLDWDFAGSGMFFFFGTGFGIGGEVLGLSWKWDKNENPTTFLKRRN